MSKLVIVFEKNPAIQGMIASALSQKFQLYQESDPQAFIKQAKSNIPDLIFISNVDCDADYELCRALQQEATLSQVPRLLLMNARDSIDLALLEQLGLQGQIRKPFEAITLYEQIQRFFPSMKLNSDLEQEDSSEEISVFDDEMLGLIQKPTEGPRPIEEHNEQLEQFFPVEETIATPIIQKTIGSAPASFPPAREFPPPKVAEEDVPEVDFSIDVEEETILANVENSIDSLSEKVEESNLIEETSTDASIMEESTRMINDPKTESTLILEETKLKHSLASTKTTTLEDSLASTKTTTLEDSLASAIETEERIESSSSLPHHGPTNDHTLLEEEPNHEDLPDSDFLLIENIIQEVTTEETLATEGYAENAPVEESIETSNSEEGSWNKFPSDDLNATENTTMNALDELKKSEIEDRFVQEQLDFGEEEILQNDEELFSSQLAVPTALEEDFPTLMDIAADENDEFSTEESFEQAD